MEFKESLLKVIIEILKVADKQEYNIISEYVVYRNEEEPFAIIDIEDRVDEELFVRDIQIEKLESFNSLYKIVKGNTELSSSLLVDTGGNPLINIEWEISWLSDTIINFIIKYLKKANREYDTQVFDTLFDEFLSEIKSGLITYVILSPLYNLQIKVDEIIFSENLKIRKIGMEELGNWANSYIFPLRPDQVSELQCAIEYRYIKQRFESKTQDLDEYKQKILQDLRLYFNSNIYIPFTIEYAESYLERTIIHTADAPERMHDRLEFINEVDIDHIVNLWVQINDSPNSRMLALSLRRWSNAFGRDNIQDKIIDYWIGLESLMTPDSNQEIKYRASLRIAQFLGETSSQRKEIYDQMRKSYDRRSQIVHGSSNLKNDLDEVVIYTGEHLRTIINKIIQMNHNFNIQDIDGLLLD